jgi:hypothetical protein
VSADEAGNVYVAGGDAVYVKQRTDQKFLRFDSQNAGLTVNCNDRSEVDLPTPTKPPWQCRVLAVGGASPGKAIIGFEGFSNDVALPGWDWVLATGGADVVRFDAAAGTLSRVRHVDIGSPPHVICGSGEERGATNCPATDYWWQNGRRLFHKVRRIVVNHDQGSPLYGDAWMCGEHATFAVLLANAAARGYVDMTAGQGARYADEKDVWEHLHPALDTPTHPEWFVNGECTALSIDPRDGKPWASNQYRTAWVEGYGPSLQSVQWWMGPTAKPGGQPWIDVWRDPSLEQIFGATFDAVMSITHCADGTAWVGSLQHGLARIATNGSIATLDLPDPALGDAVTAVACDPLDSSLWIGLGHGGVMRLRNGSFEPVDTSGVPAFANQPVQNIQLDRWADMRIVYFAFGQTTIDGSIHPGGIASYAGP